MVAMFLLLFVFSAGAVRAYSYLGYKWYSGNAAIQVEASWPSAWISPLASSMSAWNNAGSSFYFTTGGSGHSMTMENAGYWHDIGETSVYASGSSVYDIDTVINSYYDWSTSGEAGKFDVQNVVTHELGHWLVLGDLSGGGDTEKTMYGVVYTGETKKRTLHSDDITGINYIY